MIADPATIPNWCSPPAEAVGLAPAGLTEGDCQQPHAPIPDPLSALLTSTLPVTDLAATLGLSLPDLLNLYQSESFQDQLAAVDDLTQTRLRIQSSQARLTAIQALESLTKSAIDPVERRRAASNLIRATTNGADRASDRDASHQTPARPRTRQLPSRRLRAQQVAALIARALADNDTPTPDSGLATLHAFLSENTRAAHPHLQDFIAEAHDTAEGGTGVPPVSEDSPLPDLQDLADLIDHPGVAECSEPTRSGRLATVDVRIGSGGTGVPPVSPCPFTHRFHLSQPDTGPNRSCWLIDRITRIAPPDPMGNGHAGDSS